MEHFFATHNDASAGFFGESLVGAARGVGEGSESDMIASTMSVGAAQGVREGSESGMSASAMSASAAPPTGRRKVAVTRNKLANFSSYEDKVDYGRREGAREEGDFVGIGIQQAVCSRGSGGRTRTMAARADAGHRRAQARERSD
jgi:hypothetical protein